MCQDMVSCECDSLLSSRLFSFCRLNFQYLTADVQRRIETASAWWCSAEELPGKGRSC